MHMLVIPAYMIGLFVVDLCWSADGPSWAERGPVQHIVNLIFLYNYICHSWNRIPIQQMHYVNCDYCYLGVKKAAITHQWILVAMI